MLPVQLNLPVTHSLIEFSSNAEELYDSIDDVFNSPVPGTRQCMTLMRDLKVNFN